MEKPVSPETGGTHTGVINDQGDRLRKLKAL